VDFLGFTIRRYPNGKPLTKPSNDALRRIRKRLSVEVKALRGSNADTVIAKLNPIISGWAAYYRIGASKPAFGALDAHRWKLVYKWARFKTSGCSGQKMRADLMTASGSSHGHPPAVL
jgi:RNA-directed DNA polymerase